MSQALEVAVGAVLNSKQQVLIARRASHKHQGGCWEFPGGKVEPGENSKQALIRELKEEIGIEAKVLRRLIQLPFQYPDLSVLLNVYLVEEFDGGAYGREQQPIQWVPLDELNQYDFPEANQPILTALSLPNSWFISRKNPCIEDLNKAISNGAQGFMLRQMDLEQQNNPQTIISTYADLCQQQNIAFCLNGSVELANKYQLANLHLNSKRLMALQSRTEFNGRWLSASCHNLQELQQAQQLGLDFVTLSPLLVTDSHPNAQPLGWQEFAQLVAEVNIPVYALGGLKVNQLEQAWNSGAQGIAAISGWLE